MQCPQLATRCQGRAERVVGGFGRGLVVFKYVASVEQPVVCPCCPPGGVWLQSARQRQVMDQ